jgi:hypothetical protein
MLLIKLFIAYQKKKKKKSQSEQLNLSSYQKREYNANLLLLNIQCLISPRSKIYQY